MASCAIAPLAAHCQQRVVWRSRSAQHTAVAKIQCLQVQIWGLQAKKNLCALAGTKGTQA